MTDDTNDTIQNRSEIAFVIDAKDTNPNGDPLTADNEPRIDPVTGQCVVTDVRLKRYLRDQLAEDGHAVLIANPNDDVLTREEMYDDVEEEMGVSTEDAEPEELLKAFVKTAADVRYFGATISIDTDLADDLPDQFEGPVQFNHGRSYHEVARNTESKQLATVIANENDDGSKKDQGTFATDNRISYGVIGFGGRINDNAAEDTRLTETDVERLDTLCWRALKNQTVTRSKAGQQPRLYVRVEYEQDGFEIGRLNDRIDVASDLPEDEIRGTDDFHLDVSELVTALADNEARIKTVHVTTDSAVDFVLPEGETGDREAFYAALEDALSSEAIDTYDVYERYTN
ncbi:type I-B CRISPR-associated protein Cas7/Csh2 [Natrinema salifodinae]|uniref:CRISPR-associated protein Csh2 n=1 Tax=Natrinema salifodinae TaxID=1202768 RepID=A0A1I0P7S2_9EURY|nr:type I-B CRISPR-associated protein Cas7/Csh2 [Natrinema salifodinae]SEW10154.1 CRISPR-associated protein Csh2 [Natrinema salifodinae]